MKFSKTLLLALVAGALATSKNEEICRIEKNTGKQICYPKVFVPSEEWQVVWPDQVIPAGLHVRMDYENGVKEAKINDPNEEVEGVAVAVSDEVPEGEVVIEDLTGEVEDEGLSANEKVQRAIEKAIKEKRIKEGHKPNPNIPESDHQTFTEAVGALRDYVLNEKSAKLPIALSQLEELAHEIDFGIALSDVDPLNALLHVLDDAKVDVETKIMAARTIGASLRNNAHALNKVLDSKVDLVKSLLDDVAQSSKDKTDKLSSSLVYALSAVLKTPETVTRFVDLHGGDSLRKLYETGSDDVKGRVSTLIEDVLATPDLHNDFSSITGAVKKRSVNWWQDELKEWSGVFQKSLPSKLSSKAKSKVYASLAAIRRNFRESVDISEEFLEWLDHPKKAATELGDDMVKLIKQDRSELWGNSKARKYDARDEL
ncbi:Nucleotide exchange factor SIL1 [Yarrowia sp. C11]|nr:Nucleotide exchange factor SIL1 [Yarrowia sp. C11]KAG5371158.1 Nucleotide exchange factor SIL1 [Yarrowia sp. E02]